MEVKLELLNEFRNEVLWLYADLTVERTVSAVLSICMNRGQKIDDAKEMLASILNDREKLHGIFDDREFLIGATESEWELMLDEYIPALLETQIESMESLSSLPQEDNDEIIKGAIGRKRRMGFVPK